MQSHMTITSVEQIQALGHPIRQGVLRKLASGPKTNKQLAIAMGVSPGRLHFHVQELARAGLIELAFEQAKGGILEKYYQAVALHYRIELPISDAQSPRSDILDATLDNARSEYERAASAFEDTPPATYIAQEEAILTQAQLRNVHDLMNQILEIMRASHFQRDASSDSESYIYSGIFHRIIATTEGNNSHGNRDDPST